MYTSKPSKLRMLGCDYNESQLCIVCTHLLDGAELYEIAHDHDDVLQLMCSFHPHGQNDAVLLSAGNAASIIANSGATFDLHKGHYATKVKDGWEIKSYEDI